MKCLLIILPLTLFVSNLFAAPAVSYTCLGRNDVDKSAVVFSITFADHDHEVGYTDQSIRVKSKGSEDSGFTPVTYQMFGATKKNNCTKNEIGETYLKTVIDMQPLAQGRRADYIATLTTNCGPSEEHLSVKAYCVFDY